MGLARIREEQRRREEEEEKRREEQRKASLRQALERAQNKQEQGPRPKPEPLPNPWEAPTFSQPQAPQPSGPSPYSSSSLDTSAPSVGSSYQSPTRTIETPQVTQRTSPVIAPRPMMPSLSDRLREPTQPDPWKAPALAPQRPYQLQSDEPYEGDNLRRQLMAAQPEPVQNQIGNALQQGWSQGMNALGNIFAGPEPQMSNAELITGLGLQPNEFASDPANKYTPNDPVEFWNAYTNTPEYLYAQQDAQDRKDYKPPAFMQGIAQGAMEGANLTGGLAAPMGAGFVGALAGAGIGLANQFGPSRAAVRFGQDVAQQIWEVPVASAFNAPLPGFGFSASEVITPIVQGIAQGMTPEEVVKMGKGQSALSILVGRVGQQMQQTQRARGAVAKAVAETGNPQLAMANRNIWGSNGAERVMAALNTMQKQDEIVAALNQQAAQIQTTDPVKASQLFAQAQELERMSFADIVEANMDPVAELAYGLVDPTDLVLSPLIGVLSLLPEARALAKAGKAVDIDAAEAIARLTNVAERGQRLSTAVAEGGKVAQDVYRELIVPYQGVPEQAMNQRWLRWTLLQNTPASKAALDTKVLGDGLRGIFGGIVSKADGRVIMNAVTTNPKDLVRGVPGLSRETLARFGQPDGTVRWGTGVIGSNDVVRRMPLLHIAQEELLNMKALQGEGNINPVHFQAELKEIIYDAARRVQGGKQPSKLPFGAADVKVERLGPDSAQLVYVDSKGNPIRKGVETTIPAAQKQLDNVRKSLDTGMKPKDIPYRVLKTFADVQRYVMNDVWLFARPANWAGNALSASVLTYAQGAWGLDRLSDIQDWNAKIFGGFMGNDRLFNTLPGVDDLTRTMRDEVGGSAIGATAAAIEHVGRTLIGKPSPVSTNPVTRGMKALQNVPYGPTEIRLGKGTAIPIGEEALAARAFYIPAKRAYEGAIRSSADVTLGPKLAVGEGMSPELVEMVKNKAVSLAQTGGKPAVLPGIRDWLGKPTIKKTLQELEIPGELISPPNARRLEQLLMDASPSEYQKAWDDITEIFHDERNRPASMLAIEGGQPAIQWTEADQATEAAWMADKLVEDAGKAGVDLTQAKQQATTLATDYLKEQQATFNRLLQDLEPVATSPKAWDAIMDFYLGVNRMRGNARQVVDAAGQRARELGTPQAWQEKWTATTNIYSNLPREIAKAGEQTRLSLLEIYNGGDYTPRYDWWDAIENYMKWDEEEFARVRLTELGGVEDDMQLWEDHIRTNREYADNAQYELLGSFQMYPSMESFDIVRNTLRRSETEGARVAFELSELRKRRATGELSKAEYNRIRNAKWNQFFDEVVILNRTMEKIIVRNGLAKQTKSGLKWAENGVTYELLGPSDVAGKWRARNTATGDVGEEFTVGDPGEGANPFAVPKNVVDDFNRLANNEPELEKAAEAVMEEIASTRQADTSIEWRSRRTPPQEVPAGADEPIAPGGVYTIDEAENVAPLDMSPTPLMDDPAVPRPAPLPQPTPRNIEFATVEDELKKRYADPNISYYKVATDENGQYMGMVEVGGADMPRGSGVYEDYQKPGPITDKPIVINPDDPFFKDIKGQLESVRPTPEVTATVPTLNDIRKAASDAGIATTTKAGKPTDKQLINSLNKRMGTSIKKLDDLSEAQRLAAVDALAKRAEEQVSRMSPAEVKRVIEAEPTTAPQALSDYGQGKRVEGTARVEFAKPATYRGRKEIAATREGAGVAIEGPRAYIIEHAKGSNTYYVNTRPHYADDGKTLGSSLSLAEAKNVARDYLQQEFKASQGFGTGVRVDTSATQAETLPLATGKPPKKVPDAVFGKQFDRMSSQEILAETRQELLAGGYSERDIADLAKNREDLLSAVANVRNTDIDELDGMKRYDFAVPSISDWINRGDTGDGYNLWRKVTGRGSAAGNNGPIEVANIARVTIENLNDAERALKSNLSRILQGDPNTLSGAQKMHAIDAVADWLPEIDNAATKAQRVGSAMQDHIMLNVNKRRDFDTMLGLMTPYHFFWSRMPSRLVMAALAKPSLINFFYETGRAIGLENEQSDVPNRFGGTVGIPGTRYRANVSTPLFHYAMGGAMNYMDPGAFVEEDATDNAAEQLAKQWEKAGGPGLHLWLQFALDIADGKLDKDYTNVLNSMVPIIFTGIPGSSAYQALTGDMPAAGNPWNLGFGPDDQDPYRARRTLSIIGVEEKLNPIIVGYANQVIVNQSQGAPVEANIPERYLDDALALAERAVRQAAGERILGRFSAYLTTVGIQPYHQAEEDMLKAQEGYFASGYDPITNPQGNKELQKAIMETPTGEQLDTFWTKGSETPGLDAQIDELYAEANATGDWQRIMPQIEALQAQAGKQKAPMTPPVRGSTSDILRGSYGNAYKGMNPQEQLEAQQEEAASTHWDAYHALPKEDDSRAEYLRNNPDFVEIYDANEVKQGREIDHWWEDGSATTKGSKSLGSGQQAKGGGITLDPGSVTRDDFSEEELDQYYGEYLAFNETKDWDGQKAWLLEHPEFARLEADRKFEKDGEYPWWYEDVFDAEGNYLGAGGAPALPKRPSQPTSVADILRQPYDAPPAKGSKALGQGQANEWGDEWDEYRAFGDDYDAKRQYMLDHPEFADYYVKRYGKDSAWWLEGGGSSYGRGKGGSGGGDEWSTEWDEYRALGEDWDAKKKFMLDNPAFAKYYADRYGNTWWLDDDSSGSTYSRRAYTYYGGGGGGYSSGSSSPSYQNNTRIDPRYMDRSLWESPGQQRQWIPYSQPQPDWLRAGQELRPEFIRRWQPPRWG